MYTIQIRVHKSRDRLDFILSFRGKKTLVFWNRLIGPRDIAGKLFLVRGPLFNQHIGELLFFQRTAFLASFFEPYIINILHVK